MPTSRIPSATPVGSEISTSVRTPGEASAPRKWRSCSSSGSTCRVGGSAVKTTLPTTTAIAETISAPAGEKIAAIAAVSSGPLMKTTSISVESSA